MTSQRPSSEKKSACLLFLAGLLLMGALRGTGLTGPGDKAGPWFCVEARGAFRLEGIHCFEGPPSLGDLLERAGACAGIMKGSQAPLLDAGAGVLADCSEGELHIELFEMSPYHRITLGIPISLGQASRDDLMAVPGIGPRTAEIIVEERERRGGALSVEDIASLPGVGPGLAKRIEGYLTR
jgi:hypothetical protein